MSSLPDDPSEPEEDPEDQVPPDLPPFPPIRVQGPERVLRGFPFPLAVTLDSTTVPGDWYRLPGIDLLSPLRRGPVGCELQAEDGTIHAIQPASIGQEPPLPFTLDADTDRTMLHDLANAGVNPPPGRYVLRVSYHQGRSFSRAEPIQLEVVEPVEEDRLLADRLRRENDAGQASWVAFVRANWRTVDAAGLSPEGRRALGLHLFLHRAAYGPEPVAELDPAAIEPWAQSPFEGEAALLRLEILRAQGGSDADALEAMIRERWLGLVWRLKRIARGEGRLGYLRRTVGAGRNSLPSGPRPYT